MLHGEAKASLPPTPSPKSIGGRILEVHFYPDHHVEPAYPGRIIGNTRLPFSSATCWLVDHYDDQLSKRYTDEGKVNRCVARGSMAEVSAIWRIRSAAVRVLRRAGEPAL